MKANDILTQRISFATIKTLATNSPTGDEVKGLLKYMKDMHPGKTITIEELVLEAAGLWLMANTCETEHGQM